MYKADGWVLFALEGGEGGVWFGCSWFWLVWGVFFFYFGGVIWGGVFSVWLVVLGQRRRMFCVCLDGCSCCCIFLKMFLYWRL